MGSGEHTAVICLSRVSPHGSGSGMSRRNGPNLQSFNQSPMYLMRTRGASTRNGCFSKPGSATKASPPAKATQSTDRPQGNVSPYNKKPHPMVRCSAIDDEHIADARRHSRCMNQSTG
ncbi:conserved hypothetical protein [Ricinus communis]|uniref:Uncharacterized protein n=1 Tax=Ricinus communis TaxID=3988 RepID=B9REP1_RICCO|nr:conserved hypothetical protein [Ricinus communis]